MESLKWWRFRVIECCWSKIRGVTLDGRVNFRMVTPKIGLQPWNKPWDMTIFLKTRAFSGCVGNHSSIGAPTWTSIGIQTCCSIARVSLIIGLQQICLKRTVWKIIHSILSISWLMHSRLPKRGPLSFVGSSSQNFSWCTKMAPLKMRRAPWTT